MRDATPFYEATGHEIEVFERAWRHGLPVLLKGPTGCGKTRFVYNPGYQNLLKGLKPSTRQRFVALRFDYPAAQQEARILVGESGCAEALAQRLVQLGQALRRLEQHDLEEVASTRLLIFAARLIGDGMDPREACRVALAEPLSDDPATVAALMDIVDLHVA